MIVKVFKKNAFVSTLSSGAKIIDIYLIFLSALYMSCGSTDKNEISHHSVNPFDTTQLQKQVLTDEDRSKLAMATGKKAQLVSATTLASRIQQSTDKLYVYCFWDSQNEQSMATLRALQQASQSLDSTDLQVVFVNLSQTDSEESVNLFIRENQFSDEFLFLDKADFNFFYMTLKKNFSALPVTIMVNKAADIFEIYDKPLEQTEFQALIQPFL